MDDELQLLIVEAWNKMKKVLQIACISYILIIIGVFIIYIGGGGLGGHGFMPATWMGFTLLIISPILPGITSRPYSA